jgi:DNA topoisomerase-3
VSRSLIICEKPSVAQDVAKALFGSDAKKSGDHWEGPEAIVAYAVGHLVEQVDPEAYDERYKKWRYEDLPSCRSTSATSPATRGRASSSRPSTR